MGVQGILPKILPSVGTPLELKQLKIAKVKIHSPPSGENETNASTNTLRVSTMTRSRRRARAAVDISTWIAKACHGHGGSLVDERYFSTYGRAQLQQQFLYTTSTDRQNSKIPASKANVLLDARQVERFISNCAGFVMSKIDLLLQQQIDLVVVLDGQTPPIKKNQVNVRKRKREVASFLRDDLYSSHKDDANRSDSDEDGDLDARNASRRIKAARRAGASTSTIYSSVVQALLSLLRLYSIDFLVAPYEADGQLTYLCKQKLVDFIISEVGQ